MARLTGVQRLELQVLCADFAEAVDHRPAGGRGADTWARATVPLVLYCRREGIRPWLFSPRDRRELRPAYWAAGLIDPPDGSVAEGGAAAAVLALVAEYDRRRGVTR